MHEFFHAVSVFSNELASVSWTALAVALGLHLVKILLRTVAYRNIVRAAHPEENVRWAPVAGAYIVGVGVNSIVPGRAGDLVKLLAGSYGTLGFLLEATFKVTPRAERTTTLALEELDDRRAVAALAAALGSPFGVTGAAHLPPAAEVRQKGAWALMVIR